jgi:CRP/FNR family transcriptional regulator
VLSRLGADAALASHLLRKTREALRQALALSGEFTADQRVAAFLLHVHARIGHGDVVRLPMTRREMGSYLRLATETVCRVLTRFEGRGWITSSDKRITLRDIAALRELAEPVGLDR